MTANALQQKDYVQDNVPFAEETWEVKRRTIAAAAEAACKDSADFEDFVLRYSIRFSGFA